MGGCDSFLHVALLHSRCAQQVRLLYPPGLLTNLHSPALKPQLIPRVSWVRLKALILERGVEHCPLIAFGSLDVLLLDAFQSIAQRSVDGSLLRECICLNRPVPIQLLLEHALPTSLR